MKTSCAIIISHYESLPFLHTCIRQTRKNEHPNIQQIIYIIDQSCDETCNIIYSKYKECADIRIVRSKPLWSGYGFDYLLRNIDIKEEYICQLHTDAFGIHKNWLYLPIKLIQNYDLSFVGQLQFINRGDSNIYPPDRFFSMAQCFNVARLETYKEMALEAGFTRFENRPAAGMEWNSSYWDEWAKIAPNKGWSDDDVIAFNWEDKFRQHDKLSLAITGYIAPPYCRIIDDLVFHFGSCREAIGMGDRMPQEYWEYTERIKHNYSDALIEEMVGRAKANRVDMDGILGRNLWDGHEKDTKPIPKEMLEMIESLKQEIL